MVSRPVPAACLEQVGVPRLLGAKAPRPAHSQHPRCGLACCLQLAESRSAAEREQQRLEGRAAELEAELAAAYSDLKAARVQVDASHNRSVMLEKAWATAQEVGGCCQPGCHGCVWLLAQARGASAAS